MGLSGGPKFFYGIPRILRFGVMGGGQKIFRPSRIFEKILRKFEGMGASPSDKYPPDGTQITTRTPQKHRE